MMTAKICFDCLVPAELRPALRRWDERTSVQVDCSAIEFRNHLSRLAGERLENIPETSPNPS